MKWPLKIAASRLAMVAALAAAFWPVLRWYAARLTDGSDEPWGLFALAAALYFAPREGWNAPLEKHRAIALCLGLAVYVLGYGSLPPLVQALLFVTCLTVAVPGNRFPLAWWALVVLSLPVIASLQFYLGYPLRLATTALCTPLLRIFGLHVTAEATTLHWAGETVIVDAPCSGIHMLWTGLFMAAALSCWQRFDNRRALRLLRWASLSVFTANVLRATALFCIEAGIWPSPAWAHEGVGLALFAFAATVIYRQSLSPAPASAHATPTCTY